MFAVTFGLDQPFVAYSAVLCEASGEADWRMSHTFLVIEFQRLLRSFVCVFTFTCL